MEQTKVQALQEQSLRLQLVFAGTIPSRERDDFSAFGHQISQWSTPISYLFTIRVW
jgi:hypothetical protein